MALSKKALEALAFGLKVVRRDGKVFQNVSDRHRPENVDDRTIEIYRETPARDSV